MSGGLFHTCGIQTDHTLWCWGSNFHGQVGDGTDHFRWYPQQIGEAADWTTVEAGESTPAGCSPTAACGAGATTGNRELGVGDTDDRFAPTVVGTPGSTAVSLGAGDTWGAKSGHAAYCWGYNGDGAYRRRHRDVAGPTRVGWSWCGHVGGTRLAAGGDHSCAVRRQRNALVLGCEPRWTAGGRDHQLAAHLSWSGWREHAVVDHDGRWPLTCGLRSNGTLWCWGDNADGEVGDGTTTNRSRPVMISATDSSRS